MELNDIKWPKYFIYVMGSILCLMVIYWYMQARPLAHSRNVREEIQRIVNLTATLYPYIPDTHPITLDYIEKTLNVKFDATEENIPDSIQFIPFNKISPDTHIFIRYQKHNIPKSILIKPQISHKDTK